MYITRYPTRPQPFLRHAFTDHIQTWQADNESWLTYACHLFLRSDLRWPTSGHFSCEKHSMLNMSSTISRACIYRCCLNLANRYQMMPFKSMSFFFSRSDPRWPIGSHFSFDKTRYWTRPQPFLGQAFTDVQTWHTDWLTCACHFCFDVRCKIADWPPFSCLNVSPTISQTCRVQFCWTLEQAQYMIAYTCTSLYFAIWSKMTDW